MANWLQQAESKFKFQSILQLAREDWHDANSEKEKEKKKQKEKDNQYKLKKTMAIAIGLTKKLLHRGFNKCTAQLCR